MPERVETVVIGGGQAGLAVSHHLTANGREHVVLERGAVAETWRSARWDGFYLNTPNFALQVPGHEYRGPEPDAFSSRAEVVAYLEGCARGAPVRVGVEATSLRPEPGGRWLLETSGGALSAASVVVATGAFQRPHVPADAAGVPDDVLQLVPNDYRRPDQLPAGAVLIVGSGQTGCQIADELRRAGRPVYLSAGACPWFPRRYRGADIVHWAIESGLYEDTVDTLPSPAARLACNPAVSGNDGGHDCNARWLAARGAVPVGRLERVEGTRVTLAAGLEASLTKGDEFLAGLKRRIDEHIESAGVDAPPAEAPEQHPALPDVTSLDLRDDGIGTIIWATGYRPDFGWIDGAPFDDDGWPVQARGVSPAAGLFFVGLQWLHKRKSALLFGVGEDAEHVVAQLG